MGWNTQFFFLFLMTCHNGDDGTETIKHESIRLPVAVRGSSTSVFKFRVTKTCILRTRLLTTEQLPPVESRIVIPRADTRVQRERVTKCFRVPSIIGSAHIIHAHLDERLRINKLVTWLKHSIFKRAANLLCKHYSLLAFPVRIITFLLRVDYVVTRRVYLKAVCKLVDLVLCGVLYR